MRTDTQSEASKMKGIEVCEAGDFPLGFSYNHFRKRMTAMYVNPISVVFQKKKKKKRLSKFYVRKILISIYIHQKIHYCHYLANYEDVTIEDVTSP